MQLLIRSEAASHVLVSGCTSLSACNVYALECVEWKRQCREAIRVVLENSIRRLRSYGHVVLAVEQGGNNCADERCAISQTHASGEEPSPLSNGLSLVPARPSTINPQGVRYASVRPLRLRLRGDRGRPRTRRRLSSGDGPRLKTGAFQCRTISPSLRTMPSIWPAR